MKVLKSSKPNPRGLLMGLWVYLGLDSEWKVPIFTLEISDMIIYSSVTCLDFKLFFVVYAAKFIIMLIPNTVIRHGRCWNPGRSEELFHLLWTVPGCPLVGSRGNTHLRSCSPKTCDPSDPRPMETLFCTWQYRGQRWWAQFGCAVSRNPMFLT